MPDSRIGEQRLRRELSPTQDPTTEAQTAVVAQWSGRSACALQAAVRMSQEAFAEKLGVGARTVGKWHQHPEAGLRATTSAMLDTTLARLDEPTRHRFAMFLAEGGAEYQLQPVDTDWLMAAAAESSVDALSRSGQLGAEVLPDLIQHVMQIARGYDSESRTAAFKHARVMREMASHLADTTRRPGELADIYLALGQLNGLMASLAFDLGSWQASAQLARAASRYGDLAGHASLHAWALGLEATLAFWSEDGMRALDRVTAALSIAPAGAPTYRILHIAARAHAVLGDCDGTRSALQQAGIERVVMDGRRDELHDSVGGEFAFGEARAEACAGAAWLRLGRGREALDHTQRSMAFHFSGLAPTTPGVIHGASVDSGAAFLLQGDVESAETLVRPVLQLNPDPVNASLGGRLKTVSRLLDRSSGSMAETLARDVRSWLNDASVKCGD